MIDLKDLRENPDAYRDGAAAKQMPVDIDRILALDEQRRALQTEIESLRAEQKRLAKESGPQIGKLSGQLKKAEGEDKARIEAEITELKARPAALKDKIQTLEDQATGVAPELDALLLSVPLPPASDVPMGTSADDNVELRTWNPASFDPSKSFQDNRGFAPKSHVDLMTSLGMVDFERGVKLAGTRSYALTGDGMRLHHAVLRFAMDLIASKGFSPTSVPVLVREEAMVGTGFFPAGKDQTYHIEETARGGGQDMFLTGTGEVGLMGLHMDEILDEADLPIKMCTVSTCFRREAGAAGKDTAGLYRIHQFDKVEQVVICKADDTESRAMHQEMIGIVEELVRALELPYRLLQCCTGDLGVKNADMIDVECWMPSRGENAEGAYGETHSASRLNDFQCRRLNMRYRPGGEGGKGGTTFCYSLNNTVAASPRLLIPLVEIHQREDGRIGVPQALRPYVGGAEVLG